MISYKSYYKNFKKIIICKLLFILNEKFRINSVRGFGYERLFVFGMKFLMVLKEVSFLMMILRLEVILIMLELFNNGLKLFSSLIRL